MTKQVGEAWGVVHPTKMESREGRTYCAAQAGRIETTTTWATSKALEPR
jgi:hypothetical protein